MIRANRRLFAELAVALRGAARARAAADRHAGVDAAAHLARAARRVRPDPDRDGIDARPGGAAGRRGTPLRADLREIGEIAQADADNVRSCRRPCTRRSSRSSGLESTIDWYLGDVRAASSGCASGRYTGQGAPVPVDGTVAIHVYRVLQEALSNVARHARYRPRRGCGCDVPPGDASSSRSRTTASGLGDRGRAARARPGGDARARRPGRRHDSMFQPAGGGRHLRPLDACPWTERTSR